MAPVTRAPSPVLRRWRRRRQQRGAAVFVIVLVITLLSALGIWASRSATLVDMATGHTRHALQVQYLADMGLQSTTAFLANGLANEFVRQGQLGIEVCTQSQPLQDTPRNPFCYPFFSQNLSATFAAPLLVSANAQDGQNSLGPYGRNAVTTHTPQGDFVVEMTDLGPAPPCPGCEVDDVNVSVKHGSVVLTAIATIFPDDGTQAPGVCQMAGSSTSGRQMMRAQAVVGPLFQ